MVHFLRRVKDDRFTKYLFGRLVDLEKDFEKLNWNDNG